MHLALEYSDREAVMAGWSSISSIHSEDEYSLVNDILEIYAADMYYG